jgi:hypothetical protein
VLQDSLITRTSQTVTAAASFRPLVQDGDGRLPRWRLAVMAIADPLRGCASLRSRPR